MMYYLWVFHYSLIKGIYRKRHKNLSASADALAFMCLVFFILGLFLLFIDKELLWDMVRKRVPYGPVVKSLLFLLLPLFLFLFSSKLTSKKIQIIRKVIVKKNKIERSYSVLYVAFFVVLFVSSVLIAIAGRTPRY